MAAETTEKQRSNRERRAKAKQLLCLAFPRSQALTILRAIELIAEKKHPNDSLREANAND